MDDSPQDSLARRIRRRGLPRHRSKIRCRWMLHVPTAPHRPGDVPCFAPIRHQPGDLPRPDTLAPHDELHDHASGLIRVLDDDGEASRSMAAAAQPAAASQRPGNDAASAALRCADDRDAAAGAAVVLRVEQGRGSGRRWPVRWRSLTTTCCFRAIASRACCWCAACRCWR